VHPSLLNGRTIPGFVFPFASVKANNLHIKKMAAAAGVLVRMNQLRKKKCSIWENMRRDVYESSKPTCRLERSGMPLQN
jgi:hypothetical protein